jgi:hypothetical protein
MAGGGGACADTVIAERHAVEQVGAAASVRAHAATQRAHHRARDRRELTCPRWRTVPGPVRRLGKDR